MNNNTPKIDIILDSLILVFIMSISYFIIFFPEDYYNILINCRMNSNLLFLLIIFINLLLIIINILILYKLVSWFFIYK